jgi:hypothetical protein
MGDHVIKQLLLGLLASFALASGAQAAIFTVTYCASAASCDPLGPGGEYANPGSGLSGPLTRLTLGYDTRRGNYRSGAGDMALANDYPGQMPLVYGTALIGGTLVKIRTDIQNYVFHSRNNDIFDNPISPTYSEISDDMGLEGFDGRYDILDFAVRNTDDIATSADVGFQAAQNSFFYMAVGAPPSPNFGVSGIALGGEEAGGFSYQANDIYIELVRVDVISVPEPATWALLIGGFGLAGATLRKRPHSAA